EFGIYQLPSRKENQAMKHLAAAAAAIALLIHQPAMAGDKWQSQQQVPPPSVKSSSNGNGNGNDNKGPQIIGIYDATNRFVGTLVNQENLARVFNNKIYLFPITEEGLTDNALFFYLSNNCSGNVAYLFVAGFLVETANYDGQTVWVTSDNGTMLT